MIYTKFTDAFSNRHVSLSKCAGLLTALIPIGMLFLQRFLRWINGSNRANRYGTVHMSKSTKPLRATDALQTRGELRHPLTSLETMSCCPHRT